MKSDGSIIFAEDTVWRVVCRGADGVREVAIETGAGASVEMIAGGVVSAMTEAGCAGSPAILAVPSSWCLSARIATDGLPRKNRRMPMVYRLENKLPVPAEDLAIDFYPDEVASNETSGNDTSGAALGIAIETQRLASILTSLETRGVLIQNICPSVLLAVQMRQIAEKEDHIDAILWGNGAACDVVILREDRPSYWYALSQDIADLLPYLELHASKAGRALRLGCNQIDAKLLEAFSKDPNYVVVKSDDRSVRDLASAALKKGTHFDIDLRRDGLDTGDALHAVRGSLTRAAASLVVFMLVVIIGMVWIGMRYHRLASDYELRQALIFKQVLPGRALPVSIKSRLVSETRGLSGVSGNSAELPARPSVLPLLRDILQSLPGESHYRVRELRLGEGRIYLEGDAKSHGEADSVATGLRQVHGIQIDAPQTEQAADKTVNFIINGFVSAAVMAKPQAGER